MDGHKPLYRMADKADRTPHNVSFKLENWLCSWSFKISGIIHTLFIWHDKKRRFIKDLIINSCDWSLYLTYGKEKGCIFMYLNLARITVLGTESTKPPCFCYSDEAHQIIRINLLLGIYSRVSGALTIKIFLLITTPVKSWSSLPTSKKYVLAYGKSQMLEKTLVTLPHLRWNALQFMSTSVCIYCLMLPPTVQKQNLNVLKWFALTLEDETKQKLNKFTQQVDTDEKN